MADHSQDDCGSGGDANGNVWLQGSTTCGGELERGPFPGDELWDGYLLNVSPGDVLFLNVTPDPELRQPLACIQNERHWDEICSSGSETMRVVTQAASSGLRQLVATAHWSTPEGVYPYDLEVGKASAVFVTQEASGRLDWRLPVTPPAGSPVPHGDVVDVRLDAPLRAGHEFVLKWDQPLAKVFLQFYNLTADGERAVAYPPDCSRALDGVRCRVPDAYLNRGAPTDWVRLTLDTPVSIDWRMQYSHWLVHS